MTLQEMAIKCAMDGRFDADGGAARIEAAFRVVEQAAFEMAAKEADHELYAPNAAWRIRELAKDRAK